MVHFAAKRATKNGAKIVRSPLLNFHLSEIVPKLKYIILIYLRWHIFIWAQFGLV